MRGSKRRKVQTKGMSQMWSKRDYGKNGIVYASHIFVFNFLPEGLKYNFKNF